MSHRLLFCLKYRENPWSYGNEPAYGGTGSDLSSGLRNSVLFLVNMLQDEGIEARMVQLPDNNSLDRAITDYRPDTVILEAFWVVPSKLDVLMPLHPGVKTWMVRNHSNMAFISNEGIFTDWTYGYLKRGCGIICNDPRAVRDLKTIATAYGVDEDLITYGPNYYPIDHPPPLVTPHHRRSDTIDIGAYGAVRPLKNHLTMSVAALAYAQQRNKKLRFHINSTRIEQVGEPILRNVYALFDHAVEAELVEHPWMDHDEFLTLMGEMDFAMCVSFSETFCIVAADATRKRIPLLGSEEIPWLGSYGWCDPTSALEMTKQLHAANQQTHYADPRNNRILWQWRDLYNYCETTRKAWRHRFGTREST